METVEQGEGYLSRGDANCRQYGICLHLSDGSVLKVDDITTSSDEAERLAKRLEGEYIDPVQLSYLIEDYLASR